MATTTIRPFRDVSEHEVINLFAFQSGAADRGQFVKISSGFLNDRNNLSLDLPAGAEYGNTLSRRWSVRPRVTLCGSGDAPLGLLLYDVKETDENGEKLLYKPEKQAELQCVLSGQAVPVATRGIFLYSGVDGNPGAIAAGDTAYSSNFGKVTTQGAAGAAVGTFLGPIDSNNHVLLKLEL